MTYVFFEIFLATTVAYFIGYLNPPNAEQLSQKTIVFKLINATVVLIIVQFLLLVRRIL